MKVVQEELSLRTSRRNEMLDITSQVAGVVDQSGISDGDVIVLEHPLTIPPAAESGTYPIQVGLYRPPNGPRLTVEGADRLYITQIRVEE